MMRVHVGAVHVDEAAAARGRRPRPPAISSSKSPSVFGFVTMSAATRLVHHPSRRPRAVEQARGPSTGTSVDVVAAERRAGRIRPVRARRDEDAPARVRRGRRGTRARAACRASSPCAPAAGWRRHGVEAAHRAAAPASSAASSSSAPCASASGTSGCSCAKPGRRDQRLVDDRVVLHRARAERVHRGRRAVVPLREAQEVAQHLELARPRATRPGRPRAAAPPAAARTARRRRRGNRPAGAAARSHARRSAARRAASAPPLASSAAGAAAGQRRRPGGRSPASRCISVTHTSSASAQLGIPAPEREARRRCPRRGDRLPARGGVGHAHDELVEERAPQSARATPRASSRAAAPHARADSSPPRAARSPFRPSSER